MRIQANEEEQFIESVPWYLWIVADLAVFAGTIIIGRKNGTLYSIIAVGLSLILHIVGSIMAWKILQTLADKVKWKSSKAFEAMSAYSMPMYLFHQQIIYFTIVWLNGVVNPWVNAGVNFVVAIIGAFFISEFLMEWKATRFLIGEK